MENHLRNPNQWTDIDALKKFIEIDRQEIARLESVKCPNCGKPILETGHKFNTSPRRVKSHDFSRCIGVQCTVKC